MKSIAIISLIFVVFITIINFVKFIQAYDDANPNKFDKSRRNLKISVISFIIS